MELADDDPFLLLLLCKMQATRKTTANMRSRDAIATPIANFLIEMQNSSTDPTLFDCWPVFECTKGMKNEQEKIFVSILLTTDTHNVPLPSFTSSFILFDSRYFVLQFHFTASRQPVIVCRMYRERESKATLLLLLFLRSVHVWIYRHVWLYRQAVQHRHVLTVFLVQKGDCLGFLDQFFIHVRE